jgi:hypothetical protein
LRDKQEQTNKQKTNHDIKMKVYNKTNKIVDVLFKDQLPALVVFPFSDSALRVVSFLFKWKINDGKIIELTTKHARYDFFPSKGKQQRQHKLPKE